MLAAKFCILIALLVGLLISGIYTAKAKSKRRRTHRKRLTSLKSNTDIIDVDLEDCEIVSNHYFEEVEDAVPLNIQAWDALSSEKRNVTQKERNQSVLVYRTEHNGQPLEFVSPLIRKNEETLKMLLYTTKKTVIYVNKDDYSEYYFEVDFLGNGIDDE